jgi:hypothetical protein
MIDSNRWKQFRRTLEIVRPWYDPSSYRPLVLLVVVSFVVFLWPLACDVAASIYFGIPSRVRWCFGEAVLVAVLACGLRRLVRVLPTDTWPQGWSCEPPVFETASAQLIPWALRLAVVSLVIPIMKNPDGLGFADWDFVLDKFEALRRTVLIWGQFPWWNPWSRGGFPLAAEPQIGAVSIATPLVLALGTTIGLRLAAILCVLIAVEGTYRLAWLWFRDPWSAAAVALIYGLNGGVIINSAQGYVIAMSYCSLPWLAYHAFRIGDRFVDGIGLGGWTAFLILNGIQYLSFYGGLLAGLIWARAVRVQPVGNRARLFVHTLAAVGVFLGVCGWRLIPVLLVLADDKREQITYWDESLLAVSHYLLSRPVPDWPKVIPGRHWATFIELTCYVGPVVVLLSLASLARGWRWWHTLALVTGWLAIGSTQWYHPSYWLKSWPFFASAHVVTRWRFVALLGLGLAAGSVVARFRGSPKRITSAAAALLVVVIGVDLVSLAHEQLPLAFSVRPEPRYFPGPPIREIVNVRAGLGYACVMRGYGVIEGYEPMLGYHRDAPTLRRAREDRDYQGESWTARGRVEPIYWSPNRLVFQVEPAEEVFVNQNPGSWWWVNGRHAFMGRRCAEPMVPFAARADATGRLELRIHPAGLRWGIGLQIFGWALLAAAWWGRPRPAQ